MKYENITNYLKLHLNFNMNKYVQEDMMPILIFSVI